MIEKIVSGGQTGVDRAALDIAIELNIPHGGWCPKGRKAEDGIIDDKYQLQETITEDYSERTKFNVRDSDGTLIILEAEPIGGTLLTIEEAQNLNKPCLVFDLSRVRNVDSIASWINANHIQTLNIAGPRESQSLGIYDKAREIIFRLIKQEKYLITSSTFNANNTNLSLKFNE